MNSIHMPQDFKKVFIKASCIGVETVLVPATIMVGLTQAGHTMWALWAILTWNALFFAGRWQINRTIPTTSIIMVSVLLSRTLIGVAVGTMVSSEQGLRAYLLPACLLSGVMALILLGSVFTAKPLMARVLKDFFEMSDENCTELTPLFKRLTACVGVIYMTSATAGMVFVLSLPEVHIAMWTSALSVLTPLSSGLGIVLVGLFYLKTRGVKLSLRAEPSIDNAVLV